MISSSLQAARGLLTFGAVTGQTVDDDALLAGAASTDALHRCERRGLGHSRAFYRALAKLEEIQALRSQRGSGCGWIGPGPWSNFVEAFAAFVVIWLIMLWMYRTKTFIKV